MQRVYPNYYKDFKCVAGKCKHNCCIGWEIDIDAKTYEYYKTVGGEIGNRLAESIENGDAPHFLLGNDGRCPFLNKDNLCDLIIELGEEHICDICTAHPRFFNELPGRVEAGVGLTCEAAARLILFNAEKATLCNAPETSDEIIILRDKAIEVLQNREKSIEERVCEMLSLADAHIPEKNMSEWAELLLSLERLDEEWTSYLEKLLQEADFCRFDEYMKQRQTEYEQLLVYFVYRHVANAASESDFADRIAFAAFAYTVIKAIGAAIYTENGDFGMEKQAELCRMFSSEIEYSDENLYILFDAMSEA